MSRVNVDLAAAVNNLFNIPETMEKFIFPSSHGHDHHESRGVSSIIPVDILDTPKEFIFFMDVPGLSKSEIQVHDTMPHHPNVLRIYCMRNWWLC